MKRMTRKVLTMNGAFHPKSDVDRLYLSRVSGGRGLISCEGCVRGEVNSLGWYVKSSEEGLLQGVRATSVIRSEGTVGKEELKTSWNNEKLNSWKDKRLHGEFVREIPETTHVGESRSWLRKAYLKIQTDPKRVFVQAKNKPLRLTMQIIILKKRRNPHYVGYVARKVRV